MQKTMYMCWSVCARWATAQWNWQVTKPADSSHTTRVLSPQEMETADFGKALEWWDECIAGTSSYVVEMEYSSSPNVLQSLMDCAQYIRNASFVKETYR